jgi:hypothetical protein
MPNKRNPSIKDERRYEALRDEGMSQEKAAPVCSSPPLREELDVATTERGRESCYPV